MKDLAGTNPPHSPSLAWGQTIKASDVRSLGKITALTITKVMENNNTVKLCRSKIYFKEEYERIRQTGGKMSKRLGGNIGCKDETGSLMIVPYNKAQQHNVGEKSTAVILHLHLLH